MLSHQIKQKRLFLNIQGKEYVFKTKLIKSKNNAKQHSRKTFKDLRRNKTPTFLCFVTF